MAAKRGRKTSAVVVEKQADIRAFRAAVVVDDEDEDSDIDSDKDSGAGPGGSKSVDEAVRGRLRLDPSSELAPSAVQPARGRPKKGETRPPKKPRSRSKGGKAAERTSVLLGRPIGTGLMYRNGRDLRAIYRQGGGKWRRQAGSIGVVQSTPDCHAPVRLKLAAAYSPASLLLDSSAACFASDVAEPLRPYLSPYGAATAAQLQFYCVNGADQPPVSLARFASLAPANAGSIATRVLHCGARVQAVDWLPGVDSRGHHFLAVAPIFEQQPFPNPFGCLQIWDVGTLDQLADSTPELQLLVGYTHGQVLTLEWHPWCSDNIDVVLGLLAVVYSDGTALARCIDWLAIADDNSDELTGGHESSLLIGFADGSCIVLSLLDRSRFSTTNSSSSSSSSSEEDSGGVGILPCAVFHCLSSKRLPITAVAWMGDSGRFVAGDESGGICFWTQGSPFLPTAEYRFPRALAITSLRWIDASDCLLVGTSSGCWAVLLSVCANIRALPFVEQANSLATSSHHPEVAVALENGVVAAVLVPPLVEAEVRPPKHPRFLVLDCLQTAPDAARTPALVTDTVPAWFYRETQPPAAGDDGQQPAANNWYAFSPAPPPAIRLMHAPAVYLHDTGFDQMLLPTDPATFVSCVRWSRNVSTAHVLAAASHAHLLRLFSFDHLRSA